mgnify:CR=1 FL=1
MSYSLIMRLIVQQVHKNGFRSRLHLASLEPTYREVLLNYTGSKFVEKNWMLWVHEGQLYVSYSLCPHRVLRCDDRDGRCVFAYETRMPSCKKRLRGSSQWVKVDGDSLVGVAHLTHSLGGSARRPKREHKLEVRARLCAGGRRAPVRAALRLARLHFPAPVRHRRPLCPVLRWPRGQWQMDGTLAWSRRLRSDLCLDAHA